MSSRSVLLLTVSLMVSVGMFTAWLVVDRESGRAADPVSGPAPTSAEKVQVDGDGAPRTTWVKKTAARLQIPERAMQAYAETELAAARDLPQCHLRWNTVAGIGSVESAHGTLGETGLAADGVPAEPIIGPALDGTNGTRAIKATADSVTFHGDKKWDHAVGPFQFLTSSWERYGADGDGDGEKNPNDIDDAARGAANHLCVSGQDLAGDGWVPAVYGYNNAMAYVAKVRDIASGFAS